MFEIRFNSKMGIDQNFKKNYSRLLRIARSRNDYISVLIQPKNGSLKPYHNKFTWKIISIEE